MEVCGDDDSFHRPYICVGGFWWWCGAPSCFMLLSHILTHLHGWVCRPMLAYDTRLFHIMILIHGLIFIWLKCMGSVGYVEGIRVMICNWLQVSISWSLFYFSDLLLTVGSESLSALSDWKLKHNRDANIRLLKWLLHALSRLSSTRAKRPLENKLKAVLALYSLPSSIPKRPRRLLTNTESLTHFRAIIFFSRTFSRKILTKISTLLKNEAVVLGERNLRWLPN